MIIKLSVYIIINIARKRNICFNKFSKIEISYIIIDKIYKNNILVKMKI